jgi:hypothetical protein
MSIPFTQTLLLKFNSRESFRNTFVSMLLIIRNFIFFIKFVIVIKTGLLNVALNVKRLIYRYNVTKTPKITQKFL